MERDDAEARRRRLYAPGASDDDVERYRAVEPEPVATTVVAPRPSTGRRRMPIVPIALVYLFAQRHVIAGIAHTGIK